MKKLNITFCSFPDYAGNAKALYEYMKKRYGTQMNYTWIVYNEETVELLKKDKVNSILIGTDEFKKYIPKTDVFFTTQGNLDGDKLKAPNSIYVELWHGIGPKPIGFSQKNPSKEDLRGYENISSVVDYFIVPSEFWTMFFSSIFNVKYKRVKPLGLPLFDYFINSDGIDNLSSVLKIDVKKYKKRIVYMPTFRQGFNHSDILEIDDNPFNFKEDYDLEKLDKFLKENNYLLCIKMHPGEMSKIDVKETNNIKFINENDMINEKVSVNEIMNAFDLLITDYSSIGTEFVFLNKPVMFNLIDIEEYEKNRGICFGNIDFWCPGPKFKNLNQMIDEIGKILSDDDYYKKERNEKRKLWFSDLKDGGCDKICDFLFDGNQLGKNIKRRESSRAKLTKENQEQKETIETQNSIINEQIETIKKLTASDIRLKEIENSKSWKMLEKIRKIKRFRKK